jgi:hypothetical protein
MPEDPTIIPDTSAGFMLEHERELLKHETEGLRTFYSLTGPARKDYTQQMAEAEAYRIKTILQAQAEGVIAMRKAEAEGYRLIGEALASVSDPGKVIEIAKLHALQRVAQALADGKATKIFLPQNFGNILSLVGSWQEILTGSSPQGARPGTEVPSGQS